MSAVAVPRSVVPNEHLHDAYCANCAPPIRVPCEEYLERLTRYFSARVGTRTDVEDLVQSTFLAYVESSQRYEGRSSLHVFLLGIAHKLLLKHLRRRYGREVLDEPPEPPGLDPWTDLHRIFDQELLVAALGELSGPDHQVLVPFYWEELSASEVGFRLELPEGTVRTRLRSARQRLAQRLGLLPAIPRRAPRRDQARPERVGTRA